MKARKHSDVQVSRSLYSTTQFYPRKSGHCVKHKIANSKYITNKPSSDQDVMISENHYINLNLATDEAKELFPDIVRGDLVVYTNFGEYRNTGVLIYDGVKLNDLFYGIDDYGSLPPEFTPIEEGVPLNYWCVDDDNSIIHNSIVWVQFNTIGNLSVDRIVYTKTDSGDGIKYRMYIPFNYGGLIYRIEYVYQDNLYNSGIIDNDTEFIYEKYQLRIKDMFLKNLHNNVFGTNSGNVVGLEVNNIFGETKENTLYLNAFFDVRNIF